MNTMAVLIIDMQDFFLKHIDQTIREEMIANQGKVIERCVESQIPIILVQYKDRGDITDALQAKLKDVPNVTLVIKEHNSGFRDTTLGDVLIEKKIKKLGLMGINATGCVQDTAMGALSRGLTIMTGKGVIASSSKNDRYLDVSRVWFSKNGDFFETPEEFVAALNKSGYTS
ncbi:MAG: isochorismatase family cysteine hydrolase [Patescibacteria group bacterium]